MRIFALLGMTAELLCGTGTLTTSATAGVAAYLSRTGGGAACTQVAPCNIMATAITVAGANGEVVCLDKYNYGGATITFSITISCGDGLWEAPANTFIINPPLGSDVVIEGLVSDAVGSVTPVITFTGQGALHLRRVRIGNDPDNASLALVNFQPKGPAKLFVSDSYFYHMGAGGTASAILLSPGFGATTNVVIERTRIENNRFGIIAVGLDGGIIRGVVRDSIIAGNVNNGITVSTTSSNVVLAVDNCTISGNGFGLVATGANAGMLVGRSVIAANNTGLFTSSGGVLLSYRDNRLNANTSDGAFTGPVGLQ